MSWREELRLPPVPELLPYQREAVEWMKRKEHAWPRGGVLADDVGLGKTFMMAQLIKETGDTCDATLIVAPVCVQHEWAAVLQRFGLKTVLLVDDSDIADAGKVRRRDLNSKARRPRVCVVTYEKIRAAGNKLDRVWGRVVLDEGHVIRNQSTWTFGKLSALGVADTRRWILSATIVQNSESDLVSLFSFLRVLDARKDTSVERKTLRRLSEQRVLRRTQREVNACVQLPAVQYKDELLDWGSTFEKNAYAAVESRTGKRGALAPITQLRQLCVAYDVFEQSWQRNAENAANGRAVQDVAVVRIMIATQCGMNASEADAWNERLLRGKHAQALTDASSSASQRKRKAATAATKPRNVRKRARIVGSRGDDDDALADPRFAALVTCATSAEEAQRRHELAARRSRARDPRHAHRAASDAAPPPVSTKMQKIVERVCEDLHASRENKIVIFTTFIAEMALLRGLLEERLCHVASVGNAVLTVAGDMDVGQRSENLLTFTSGGAECPVLLAQIMCCSAGINLQAANRVYITSPTWNPCVEKQAIGRVHRQGQTRAVIVRRFAMADTIEERCLWTQQRKGAMIAEFVNDFEFPFFSDGRCGRRGRPAAA